MNNSAESQNQCITQGNLQVSRFTTPPYFSQPLFPMFPSASLMYNYPFVSHPYSSNQQPSPFQNQFCAGATPSYSRLQTPPHYGPSCSALQTLPQCAVSTSGNTMMKKDFIVCFKFGNVSVCSGCRQNFFHSDDILIKHEEFRVYNSPVTGAPASKFGNAYYHPRFSCLMQKWPEFTATMLTIPEEVLPRLTSFHKSLMYQEFGLEI